MRLFVGILVSPTPKEDSRGGRYGDDVFPPTCTTAGALGHTVGNKGVLKRVLAATFRAAPRLHEVMESGILLTAFRVDLSVLSGLAEKCDHLIRAKSSNRTGSPAMSETLTLGILALVQEGP